MMGSLASALLGIALLLISAARRARETDGQRLSASGGIT
jgi:hypothetical protein